MPTYNLIDCSSNYSETAGCWWFYSKDEASNFNADVANGDKFKSFKCNVKLLGNTAAQVDNDANGILKTAALTVPLK